MSWKSTADFNAQPRAAARPANGRAALWLGLTWIAITLISPAAQAAFITTDADGLTDVFSQPSFGENGIDIEFTPSIAISNASLLNIDTEAKLLDLLDHPSLVSSPVVNMVFVDTIDWCDGHEPLIVGCATVDDNFIVVESAFAAGQYAIELAAHELGHNLGLEHLSGLNLMNRTLNGNTDLTAAQVSTILMSDLVQIDEADPTRQFISITPVLVQEAPEPSTLAALWSLAIVGVGYRSIRVRRKRRRHHAR